MPGTRQPGQMFDHTMIELSGRSLTYPLDFAAPVDYSDTVGVNQGGICSLNDAGNIVAGLGDGVANAAVAGKTVMPLIAIQGTQEFDVTSDVGNFSGGVQSALVASGGYEIETTEFKQDEVTPIVYAPNDALTFGVTTDRGLLVKAADAYSTENVVGVVSRGESTTEYNKQVLSFWTVFCPPVKTA